MSEKEKQQLADPHQELESAIEKLKIFTHSEARGLEISEAGELVALKEKPLERVIGLARHFLVPIFSDQARLEREKKLSQIKQEVLKARDTIQSHSALIDKQKNGKLAHSALDAIKRYNAIVEKDYSSWSTKYDVYNYERNQILLDEEIIGQPIELPNVFSVQFRSHPEGHPAHKTLKELSKTFLLGSADKIRTSSSSATHKKSEQFMVDTFRMKAVRMIQSHLFSQDSMVNMLNLIKRTPIELDDESSPDLIHMRQILEEIPGSKVILTGSFKKHPTDSKFMCMPILDSFHLASQMSHAGHPYASQHNGWALSEKFVEAFPLRNKQVPLFQGIDQRRKRLSQLLLFDQNTMKKSRDLYLLKREIFDSNRRAFLKLHHQLQKSILIASGVESELDFQILENFYRFAMTVDSPFDFLTRAQQKMLDLLVKEPANKLEEVWLEGVELRKGTPQEKLQLTIKILTAERNAVISTLQVNQVIDAYVNLMGALYGEGSQGIILQYFSEKIGFAPPMLSEFEQKMQACAFQQLLSFLDEFDREMDALTPEEIKRSMVQGFELDRLIFDLETIDDMTGVIPQVIYELEVYFPTRFYARYPRKSYIPQEI